MKSSMALRFLLSNWVSNENCGVIKVQAGESADEFWCGICDSVTFPEDAAYFYFWTPNDSYEFDLEKAIEYAGQEFADFEFPTKNGWFILFKLEDYD